MSTPTGRHAGGADFVTGTPSRAIACPTSGAPSWLLLLVFLFAALPALAQKGITNLYQLDPLCLAPLQPDATLDPGNPPPSNRRMAERLATFRDNHDPNSLFFRSDIYAPILQKAWDEATDPIQRLQTGIQLGLHQAQAGRPDSALNTYAAMEAIIANGIDVPPSRRSQLRMRQAVAFLRMGEQENCIARHGPESCLFPLPPAAFRILPRGSRGALTVLEEQLKEFPDDLAARWLLNIAHMTLGQYPDKVPAQWLVPPARFASEHPMPRFPDVAGPAGVDVNDLGGGSIVEDFDNDGLLDIVASSWGFNGPLRFFRNTGTGRFEERTSQAGLVGLNGGLNLMQTDYNNDGRPDLYLSCRTGPNILFHNDGPTGPGPSTNHWRFSDVTAKAGVEQPIFGFPTWFFDFDNDGWEDLYASG
jgi:hypothetical protein